MKIGQFLVPLMVLAIALAGCGTFHGRSDGSGVAGEAFRHLPEQEVEAGLAAQEALLAEGDITRTEYEQAVSAMETCLRRFDITLVRQGWDPVDQRSMVLAFQQGKISEDLFVEVTDECRDAHFSKVYSTYVGEHLPRMADDLMTHTQECLSAEHVALTGREESVKDLVDASEGREDVVFACVASGMSALYPDLPPIVGY